MATNTLEIIIKANSKQAVTSLGALDKSLDKVGTTSAKGFDALKLKFREMDKTLSSPAGMKALVGTAGAVVGALTGVGLAVKGLADDYMDYAFQVKDFGRIIGATPEEASKLIQVADDVRLSVESMTTAMRSAITKGYAPTIEGLGKLSDEYLAIQDPIERSRFLVERFGRSGLEMAKLMELGGDKISEMGDSIEGTARLMTNQGIRAAENYYKALDNLGDTVTDLKLLLGSELLPTVIDVTDGMADFAADGMGVVAMFKLMQRGFETGTLSLTEFMGIFGRYMRAELTAAEIVAMLTGEILAQDAALAPGKFQNLETSIAAYASAADGAAESTDGVTTSLEDAEEKARAFRQSIASLPENISMSFDLKIPDITTEISNLLKNKKWIEAGGGAVELFYQGVKNKLATLSPADLAEAAKVIGAIELAAKVKIGEMTPAEAARQLQEAFGGGYGEALVTVKAAIEADPGSPEEIMAFLSKEIAGNPLVATIEPEIDQAKYDEIFGTGPTGLEKLAVPVIAPEIDQAIFNEIFGSGPSGLEKPAAPMIMPELDMKVYTSMVDAITRPLVVPVTIKYTTTGAPPPPGGTRPPAPPPGGTRPPAGGGGGARGQEEQRALGGPVSPGQWYMVGERGPEMFMPNTPGKIVPNNQTTNNAPVNITNNFSVVASTALDIRELARQVAREQQRAGSK